ncbi:MAG: hypothetical protein AABX33_01590 [Nanoarchaeota archaeon]
MAINNHYNVLYIDGNTGPFRLRYRGGNFVIISADVDEIDYVHKAGHLECIDMVLATPDNYAQAKAKLQEYDPLMPIAVAYVRSRANALTPAQKGALKRNGAREVLEFDVGSSPEQMIPNLTRLLGPVLFLHQHPDRPKLEARVTHS